MNTINNILGLGVPAAQAQFGQMVLRGLIVFAATVAMIRLAGRRFIAQRNPLDVMMAFILGSMLARDINGNSAFWPTLGIGFVFALAYRAIAFWACKSDTLGSLIKGRAETLVENGHIFQRAMFRHQISRNDLFEDMRLRGVGDLNQILTARIERSGEISVLTKPTTPASQPPENQTIQNHAS